MGCIYTYQGKQYNKEEFYNYVRNNLVKPKVVQKYNKILFPSGNTASRIEGHTTLEEFKKQKEDRIKELEKQEPQYAFTTVEASSVFSSKISSRFNDDYNEELRQNAETHKGKYIVVDRSLGEDGRVYGVNLPQDLKNIEIYNNKEEAEKVAKTKGTRQDNEINQLKQELERVEREGFGALKPIYNFYENTVTNILNKIYGKENVKQITDEYGNTWNEVEITDKQKELIFLQKKDSNQLNLFDQQDNIKILPPADPRIKYLIDDAIQFMIDTQTADFTKGIIYSLRKNGLLAMNKFDGNYYIHKTNRGIERLDYSGYQGRIDNLKLVVSLLNERIGSDVFNVKRVGGSYNNHMTILEINENDSVYKEYIDRGTTGLRKSGKIKQLNNNAIPIDPLLDAKMREIMSIMGISQINFEEYKTQYRKKYGKPLDAIGVADIMNKMIAVDENRADGTTLTEEVGHFVIFAMLGDVSVEKMLGEVHLMNEWSEESEVYMKEYDGDERKVRIEILGKVLTNAVRSNWNSGVKPYWKIKLKSLWRKFMSLFGLGPKGGAYIKAEINDLAQKMLNLEVKDLNERLQKRLLNNVDIFKQVDHTKYSNSKILDGRISDIEDAINISKRKIKYYQDTENDVFINKEQKVLDVLEDAKNKGLVTLGILKFVELVRDRANSIDNRLKSLRLAKEDGDLYERIHTYANILDEMHNYVQSYKDLIASMLDEYSNTDVSEMSDPDKMVYSDIMEDLKNINRIITNVNTNYKKYSKELITSYVKPILLRNPKYNGNINQAMTDFMNNLEEGKDIDSISLQVRAMSTSGSDILSALDAIMKREIESASIESEELMTDILRIHEKYGNINTSFMYEIHNGIPTGNIISEINYGKYFQEREKFMNSLKKKYGENKDDYDPETMRNYEKEVATWFQENKEKNPNADLIKEDMKNRIIKSFVTAKEGTDVYDKQLKAANEEYVYWLSSVERYDNTLQKIVYRGILSRPSLSKYKNSVFENLNSKQKEYYDEMMNIRENTLSNLSSKYRYTMLAPQTRKDWLERLKNGNFLDNAKILAKETVMHTEDEVEFVRLDESGRRIRNIPVHFFNKIENPNDLSLDFTGGMILMIDSATRHKTLKKSLNMLELTGEILNRRKILSGKEDSSGNTEKTAIGGNTARRFQEFVEMNYFGQMKFKGDEFLGMNTAKLADTFSKYVALNTLALNLYAGVNNVVLGNIQIKEESISGEYINPENIKFANSVYWDKKNGVFSLMSEIGKLTTNNKLRLFLEKVDALQDHKQRVMGTEADRNRKKRLLNSSTAFFTTHIGEHQMTSKMALALADSIKLTDSEGKTINLYDAMEVKDNKIILKEGIKKDGKDFTTDDLIDFRIRLGEINRKLHGVYNETDRSILQRTAIGRLMMQFRKYFVPSFDRRWASKRMNYALESEEEGFYLTASKIIKQLYTEGNLIKFLLLSNDIPFTKKAFSSKKEMLDKMGLSNMEKANMIRALVELNYMTGALILANVISMALGEIDDDDEPLLAWTLNSMAYQSNRLHTELGAWIPALGTNELLKLLQSPMAGMNTIDNWLKVLDTFDISDAIFEDEPLFKTYERGRHKGDLKLWIWTQHRIPMIKTVNDWFYPEEKNKYWQL